MTMQKDSSFEVYATSKYYNVNIKMSTKKQYDERFHN